MRKCMNSRLYLVDNLCRTDAQCSEPSTQTNHPRNFVLSHSHPTVLLFASHRTGPFIVPTCFACHWNTAICSGGRSAWISQQSSTFLRRSTLHFSPTRRTPKYAPSAPLPQFIATDYYRVHHSTPSLLKWLLQIGCYSIFWTVLCLLGGFNSL